LIGEIAEILGMLRHSENTGHEIMIEWLLMILMSIYYFSSK
jgi:hypothetical protein